MNGYKCIKRAERPSAYSTGAFNLCCDALGVSRSGITLYSVVGEGTASAWVIPEARQYNDGRYFPAGHRFIFYDPEFLSRLEVSYNSAWPSIGVMAHEIGHHRAWAKNPDRTRDNWDCEQAANYYQGWAMAILGAGRADIELRHGNRDKDNGSKTHPSSYHIMRAIGQGWKDAGGEKNTSSKEPDFLKPDLRWWPDEQPRTPS